MTKGIVFLIILLTRTAVSPGLFAQKPDSVQTFIDSALNIMKRHSMFSSKEDWHQVGERVGIISMNAQT